MSDFEKFIFFSFFICFVLMWWALLDLRACRQDITEVRQLIKELFKETGNE